MEIQETSRTLFMKYALPCAETLVKRGTMKRSQVDSIYKALVGGRPVPEGLEKSFKVAFAHCSILAIDNGKKYIDDEIIRDYFIVKHSGVVDRRFEEMGDFDPESCKTKIGVVVKTKKEKTIVSVDQKHKEYRNDLVPGLKKGDTVVIHWNFIIEKLTGKMIETINKNR